MGPEQMNTLTDLQARMLCDQLREQIIDSVSRTGGHLASSLGVVEATVAIHRVFDLETDRLVFDVGHQCYAHKILTQRDGQMDSLRLPEAQGGPGGRVHRRPCLQRGVGGAGHGPCAHGLRRRIQRAGHTGGRGHDRGPRL